MYPEDYRPRGGLVRPLLLALAAITLLLLAFPWPRPAVMSRWASSQAAMAEVPKLIETVIAQPQPTPATISGFAVPETVGLTDYNQASQLIDSAAGQQVSYYRRSLPSGGTLIYFVVRLGPQVHIEVINADGATPGSDAGGDTIWTDGQKHLATVTEMAQAAYAVRDGQAPLLAMAFGFHGDARTSDEGTVVINGTQHRVNPGRAALCITPEYTATIGLFSAEALRACEQANGAGPVILWQGKLANPTVSEPTEEFVPFNPLGEDFTQLEWRRKIFGGSYPKTAVGIGRQAGQTFLVFATSYGMSGLELAGQLKAMGCSDALGGDDDTSTQAAWRGQQARPGQVREVPDALAVYMREGR